MSTILVTGGSGVLGRSLVTTLRERGHDVRVLSRRAGVGTHVGDLSTGEGVRAAASGAELIVHAASASRRFGRPDPTQTRHLLDAAGDTRHLLYVSIVGVDRNPLRYYRHKLACEELICTSAVPHTILRATQFHDLVAAGLRAAARLPVTPLPPDLRFQPVATEDVASRIAQLIDAPPAGRAPDFGGPEVLTLADLVRTWHTRYGRPRRVLRVPAVGAVARAFRSGANTCPEHADGTGTWAQYLSGHPE